MLEEYAERNSFTPHKHFFDDGVSGATFERESFRHMLVEMFREKGIRLIAANENVDSFKDDDNFKPFRNITNEWYAGRFKKD